MISGLFVDISEIMKTRQYLHNTQIIQIKRTETENMNKGKVGMSTICYSEVKNVLWVKFIRNKKY